MILLTMTCKFLFCNKVNKFIYLLEIVFYRFLEVVYGGLLFIVLLTIKLWLLIKPLFSVLCIRSIVGTDLRNFKGFVLLLIFF